MNRDRPLVHPDDWLVHDDVSARLIHEALDLPSFASDHECHQAFRDQNHEVKVARRLRQGCLHFVFEEVGLNVHKSFKDLEQAVMFGFDAVTLEN